MGHDAARAKSSRIRELLRGLKCPLSSFIQTVRSGRVTPAAGDMKDEAKGDPNAELGDLGDGKGRRVADRGQAKS